MTNEIISPSGYDAKSDFLKLAEKYYDLESVNTLKTGFLGYTIEMASHIFKHGVNQRNFLYNEYFPNTANLPKSIYSFAKNINYDVNLAVPSSLGVMFILSKNNILKYGTVQKDGSIEFVISRNNPFFVKSYEFMLEYDVKIVATRNADSLDYAITAFNILTPEHELPFSNFKNPYVKMYIQNMNAEPYIFLNLNVWQMKKQSRVFNVYTNDIAEVLMYDVEFANQLAFFNVYYRYPSNENERYLPKYFNNAFTPEDEKEFCYYNYPSDTSLQVLFSGLNGTFRPQFNSELKVDYYTTLGASGNFSYKDTAEIGFRFKETQLSSIPVLIRATNDAVNGKNRQTLKEVKQSIIKQNFYQDNLATNIDLNNYFSSLMESTTVNSSRIEFHKKRDDVLRRIYSAYLLLKNKDNMVIPTNTINLDMDISTLDKNNYRFQAGTMILFDTTSKTYRLLRDDEFPESYIKSDKIILYSTPFLMNIVIDPFPRVSYFKNSVENSIPLVFKRVNLSSNYEFIINQLNIKRNSILGDDYSVSLTMNTNMGASLVRDNLKVVGIVKKDNLVYGYINFDIENSFNSDNVIQYDYSAKLTTNDQFNSEGKLILTSGIRQIGTGAELTSLEIDEDLNIEIALMFNKTTSKEKFDTFEHIDEYANYSTLCTLQTTEEFSFAKSLDLLLSSDLVINDSAILSIKSVPVIATKYFNSYDNFTELHKILDTYYETISNNLDRLQNNTAVDMKFFNTYGISKQFTIDTVNIALELNIRLFDSTNISYTDNEIKKAIVSFFDESNNDKFLSISNLTSYLQQTFKEINFIEFVSMNGMNVQRIEEIEELVTFSKKTREQIINFVPEHINIGNDFNNISNENFINSMITINYI